MKKNTLKSGLLTMLCLSALLTAKAQTTQSREIIKAHTDSARLNEISARATARFEANYKLAQELAKQNGWPLHFSDKKTGASSILVGVRENGLPVYRSTSNQGSAFTARVDNIQENGFFGYDLAGQDMLIGMWEIGYPRSGHTELTGRITSGDGSAFTGDDSNTSNAINFHATHVAGTMIGDGSFDITARGMAYEANMRAYDSFNDLGEAATAAGGNIGLLVSNHSYGLNMDFALSWEPGAYTVEAADWDDVHHAAPYYQAVWAAGNDRDNEEKDELLHECVAKNVIVVAAVHGLPSSGYTGPDSVEMSDFSTYGPTDDRRIKPDISDKGVAVWSCSSAGNSEHAFAQGTSMASPGVAGTLLLFQQHYISLHGAPMRAATLKGLMTHTADEAGDNPGPDHRFGWGLINATKAVLLMDAAEEGTPTAFIKENVFTPADESYEIFVEVSGEDPLKATIAWTDPAGPVNNGTPNSTTPRLVNDLDLRIYKMDGNTEEETFLPWRLANTVTDPAEPGDNTVDNVEVVEILEPEPGTYKVKVTYKELQGFANQNYSLIVDKGVILLGTPVNELATKMSVYPNPANDLINIKFDSSVDVSDCNITLYDMQGRQVKQFNNYVETVNTSDLSAGVYMLNISTGGAEVSRKIIIE